MAMERNVANRLFPESCESAQISYVEGYPVPPVMPMQPIKAAKALIAIYKDIEETRHVYDLAQAVSGKAYHKGFEEFAATKQGRRVLDGEVKIEELMARREWLANLPRETLGNRYHSMVTAKGFAVDGLLHAAKAAGIDVANPTMFEAFRRYFIHFEVTHDLWHVLTGYDTDALGELSLLAFYRAQWPDLGLRLLTWMGMAGAIAEQPGHAGLIWRAIREGYTNGAAASSILCADMEALLATPLRAARMQLGINEPEVYRSASYALRRSLQGGGLTIEGQREPIFEVGWA